MQHAALIFAAVTAYFAAGLLIALRLFNAPGRIPTGRRLCLVIGFVAIFLHAIDLYGVIVTSDGLNLSFFNAVSLTAWTVAALLLASATTKPVENLGILIFPLTALALVLDWRFPGDDLLSNQAGWALRAHVITSMLAYSLLTLASAQSILLAIQDNHLRHHHPGGFIRALPPLQTMEALLFELIAVGLLLLTISLGSGFVYLDDMFAQKLAHKTILSIIAWGVFAMLLWGRFRFGWRGRTAIRWTLIGFLFLMLAYFGSKAVLEFVLQQQ